MKARVVLLIAIATLVFASACAATVTVTVEKHEPLTTDTTGTTGNGNAAGQGAAKWTDDDVAALKTLITEQGERISDQESLIAALQCKLNSQYRSWDRENRASKVRGRSRRSVQVAEVHRRNAARISNSWNQGYSLLSKLTWIRDHPAESQDIRAALYDILRQGGYLNEAELVAKYDIKLRTSSTDIGKGGVTMAPICWNSVTITGLVVLVILAAAAVLCAILIPLYLARRNGGGTGCTTEPALPSNPNWKIEGASLKGVDSPGEFTATTRGANGAYETVHQVDKEVAKFRSIAEISASQDAKDLLAQVLSRGGSTKTTDSSASATAVQPLVGKLQIELVPPTKADDSKKDDSKKDNSKKDDGGKTS